MNRKQKLPNKRYIVRKYIMARSAQEALRIERRSKPDDVYVDDDWKRDNPNQLQSAIGFLVESESD